MRLIFFTDYSEQFSYRFLRGIYRYAQQTGEHWTVCRMPSSMQENHSFQEFVDWAAFWKADVVIGQFTNDVDLQAFRRKGIIVMVQDYIAPFPDVPNITADYLRTGAMAAERCVARGFRDFAFFGNEGMCWSEGRCEGFRKYLEEAGFGDHVYICNRPRAYHNPWFCWIFRPPGQGGPLTFTRFGALLRALRALRT